MGSYTLFWSPKVLYSPVKYILDKKWLRVFHVACQNSTPDCYQIWIW